MALAACESAERRVEAQSGAAPEKPAVAAVKVTVQDLSKSVILTAEFVPFEEVDVMAKVAGYVKEMRVDVGDRVRQGQTLATIEAPEMQDDLARALATIEQAEAEVRGFRE